MINSQAYCLMLIKRRLRSRFELVQKMTNRGIGPGEQEQVLEKLKSVGLVDDWRFTRSWVHTRDRLAPRGEFLLRVELIKKGIDQEIIEKVLRERREELNSTEQPSELELAEKLLEGKKRLYSGLPEPTRRRRLIGLLQRRGFSYGTIRRILKA